MRMCIVIIATAFSALVAEPALSSISTHNASGLCAQGPRPGCNEGFPEDPNYYANCNNGCDFVHFDSCWSHTMIIPAEGWTCADTFYGCEAN
jgi:hypothetical protein